MMSWCLGAMKRKVTDPMNELLSKEFIKKEVEEVIRQIGLLKSPSPNGFGACFYQFYCVIVGDEVSKVVLAFLNGGMMDRAINFTYIALIPKVKDRVEVSDYKLINFCNVLYRIITKVLTTRMNHVLEWVISY